MGTQIALGSGFYEAEDLKPFHDSELAKATKKINALITKAVKGNKDKTRELAALTTPRGLMIAWTASEGAGPYDDEKTLLRELGIKRARRRARR